MVSSPNALLKATYRFIAIANQSDNEDDMLNAFVTAIKEVSGCEAVGIRIHLDKEWLTYSAHEGFSSDFLDEEASLHLQNDPRLCIRVFHRQTETCRPFYTEGGAFFTIRADALLKDAGPAHLGSLRGTSISAGYQSLGLFPIRSMNHILGLVHVADTRPDRLSPDLVGLLENVALQLGVGLEKAWALAGLRKSSSTMASTVDQGTTALKTVVATLKSQVERRHRVKKELKRSQQLMQLVFESISDPLVMMDEKAHVLMVNRAATTYYESASAESAIGRVCFEGLGQFSQVCQACRIPAAVAEGRAMEFDREGFKDREKTEVVQLFPIRDEAGNTKGSVIQVHDVTGTRNTQQQLNRLQNQAAIGMLVSSVAHEIRNPNSFIHDVFKLMETIEHGSRRIDLFLKNLKTLGPNKPNVNCRPLSLCELTFGKRRPGGRQGRCLYPLEGQAEPQRSATGRPDRGGQRAWHGRANPTPDFRTLLLHQDCRGGHRPGVIRLPEPDSRGRRAILHVK